MLSNHVICLIICLYLSRCINEDEKPKKLEITYMRILPYISSRTFL